MLKITRTLLMALCATSFFACQSVEPTSLTIVQYNVGVFDICFYTSPDNVVTTIEAIAKEIINGNKIENTLFIAPPHI